jgi:3'5'-cyclic nucleotide phosphodiesterase
MFTAMLQEIVKARPPNMNPLGGESYDLRIVSPREEVTETIALPANESIDSLPVVDDEVSLDPNVKAEVQLFISAIASMYRPNSFHNFDHACHVVMATKKLLSRVIKPNSGSPSETAFGITSDPLTQFAIVFSALIHDLDHPGVSNAQLVREKNVTAIQFDNKSVAEQNSIALSWDILMEPKYKLLRSTIMPTECEAKRFRQIVINAVLATDLFDADLRSLRENRWKKAFDNDNHTDLRASESSATTTSDDGDHTNRLATIVIEHIIQASDISHTMQHWHIYQKWNRRLLWEMYQAFKEGRSDKDPTDGWYEGELWFFDNYIIPLANKLKTCGVFGVSCDELLNYAIENRAEWAAKGQQIVAEYVEELRSDLFDEFA